jgi:sulfatase maturation enzyme AslB (radical SAM superfamily)
MIPSDSKHFCMAGFVHTMIDTVNAVKVCCTSRATIASMNEEPSIAKVWTSETYQQLRRDMLADKPIEGCQLCYKQESQNITSDRQRFNETFKDIAINVETGNDSNTPISFDLRPNNLCNLKCMMCGPASSSQLAKEIIDNKTLFQFRKTKDRGTFEGFVTTDRYQNEEWLPELEEMILSAPNPHLKLLGGEPTLIPEHMRIMTKLADADNAKGKLNITTNLTNINNNFRRILEKFEQVHISCSVDGIGSTLEYIRHPINYESWRKNLDTLLEIKEAREIISGSNRYLNVELHTVAQVFNVYHLPEFLKFASKLYKDYGVGYSFTMAIVYKERPLDVRYIPLEDRLRVADEMEAITRDMSDRERRLSKIRQVLEALRDDSDLEKFEDKLPLVTYVVARDIARERHTKDFVPEFYKIIEPYYDEVKKEMLMYGK